MEISGKNATFILVCQWIEEKKTPERADIAWIGKKFKICKVFIGSAPFCNFRFVLMIMKTH